METVIFNTIDYIIILMMLCISAGIGIFFGCFGKRQQTTKQFLIAERKMGVFPTSLSLCAGFMSGLTLLGNPAESYKYGTMFIWTAVCHLLVTIVTSHVFIPLYINLDITSAYEYLEKRFNKYIKLLASCLFIIQMITYLSFVIYAPALAISQVTGLNIWIFIASLALVCTFYSTIGGIKVVMWADVFQMLIVLIGLIVILFLSLDKVGGYSFVIESSWVADRIDLFNFNFDFTDRHTVFGLTIGYFFLWLYLYAINQSQVQRYLSVPDIKTARRALYINLVGLWLILFSTIFIGLIIYSKYQYCDPIGVLNDSKSEEALFPLFVIEALKDVNGIPGLFLATLFSAVLSTVSSILNSLTAVTLDLIKEFLVKDIHEKRLYQFSQIICLFFGIISILVSYLGSFLNVLLQSTVSFIGCIGGPILGLFLLGLFVPISNSKGAFCGAIAGLGFSIWLFAGSIVFEINKYTPTKPFPLSINCSCNNSLNYNEIKNPYEKTSLFKLYSVSYTWYSLLSSMIALVIGTLVSCFTGRNKDKEIDPKYQLDFINTFFPFIKKLIENNYKNYKNNSQELINENSDKTKNEFLILEGVSNAAVISSQNQKIF